MATSLYADVPVIVDSGIGQQFITQNTEQGPSMSGEGIDQGTVNTSPGMNDHDIEKLPAEIEANSEKKKSDETITPDRAGRGACGH
jgi:hypothetical protein